MTDEEADAILGGIGNRSQPKSAAPSSGDAKADEILSGIKGRQPSTPSEEDEARGGKSAPDSFLSRDLGFVKGAAKSVVGMLGSIGDIAGPPGEHIIPTPFTMAQKYRDWANAPSESTSESIGYGAGSLAPGVILGPLAGAGKVANIAKGGITGAIEAGLQPTKEGTLMSHLEAMPPGFVAGAVPGITGTTLHGIVSALSLVPGLHGLHIPRLANFIYRHIRQAHANRAGANAGNAAQNLYAAHELQNVSRQVRRGVSSAAGDVTGQALGSRIDDAEDLYSTH